MTNSIKYLFSILCTTPCYNAKCILLSLQISIILLRKKKKKKLLTPLRCVRGGHMVSDTRGDCLEGQPMAALDGINRGINPHLILPSKQVD